MRMLSLSLGAGQMLTLEVLLRASSLIALSSESAALATAPVDKSVQSAAASADWEELPRAERGWGSHPSWHPPPPGQAGQHGGRQDCHRWLWYQQAATNGSWCEPITSHGHPVLRLSRLFNERTCFWYCRYTYIAADLVQQETARENNWYQFTLKG